MSYDWSVDNGRSQVYGYGMLQNYHSILGMRIGNYSSWPPQLPPCRCTNTVNHRLTSIWLTS